jgi:hypothetical protein
MRVAMINTGGMKWQDIAAEVAVEIKIRDDGKVIWVCVDVLRVCSIPRLIVKDARKRKLMQVTFE